MRRLLRQILGGEILLIVKLCRAVGEHQKALQVDKASQTKEQEDTGGNGENQENLPQTAAGFDKKKYANLRPPVEAVR